MTSNIGMKILLKMTYPHLMNKVIILILIAIIFSSSIGATSIFDYPISTVIIDPGHGGEDSGAVASYDFNPFIQEKDIVLNISLKIKEYLTKELPSLNVILTREDDTYLTLQERSEFGFKTPLPNKSSSLYVSIHANSSTTNASGFEVFTKLQNKIVNLFDSSTPIENIALYANENLYTLNKKQYDTSYKLSQKILDSVVTSFPNINNRGIKSEDLYVLNVSRTTACLVEVGFISNQSEAKLLLDNAYQDKMAKAISNGIINTIKERASK